MSKDKKRSYAQDWTSVTKQTGFPSFRLYLADTGIVGGVYRELPIHKRLSILGSVGKLSDGQWSGWCYTPKLMIYEGVFDTKKEALVTLDGMLGDKSKYEVDKDGKIYLWLRHKLD